MLRGIRPMARHNSMEKLWLILCSNYPPYATNCSCYIHVEIQNDSRARLLKVAIKRSRNAAISVWFISMHWKIGIRLVWYWKMTVKCSWNTRMLYLGTQWTQRVDIELISLFEVRLYFGDHNKELTFENSSIAFVSQLVICLTETEVFLIKSNFLLNCNSMSNFNYGF